METEGLHSGNAVQITSNLQPSCPTQRLLAGCFPLWSDPQLDPREDEATMERFPASIPRAADPGRPRRSVRYRIRSGYGLKTTKKTFRMWWRIKQASEGVMVGKLQSLICPIRSSANQKNIRKQFFVFVFFYGSSWEENQRLDDELRRRSAGCGPGQIFYATWWRWEASPGHVLQGAPVRRWRVRWQRLSEGTLDGFGWVLFADEDLQEAELGLDPLVLPVLLQHRNAVLLLDVPEEEEEGFPDVERLIVLNRVLLASLTSRYAGRSLPQIVGCSSSVSSSLIWSSTAVPAALAWRIMGNVIVMLKTGNKVA